MNGDSSEAGYTLRSIETMLGLTRTVVLGLVSAGFVSPRRGKRNEYRFCFQDVVLLRSAAALQDAHIAPRRIVSALRRLKASLPEALPLTGLRITAVGSDVTVRDGQSQWQPDSGQQVFDFEVAASAGSVSFLPHRPAAHGAAQPPRQMLSQGDAAALFEQAEAFEASDPAMAEATYREVLSIVDDHANAYLNLGALLCETERCDEAVELYDEAIRHCPDHALLHFNRAIALEDEGKPFEALAGYDACLKLSPDLADAHFNAARLHEQIGDAKLALRHFSAYRRLQS